MVSLLHYPDILTQTIGVVKGKNYFFPTKAREKVIFSLRERDMPSA